MKEGAQGPRSIALTVVLWVILTALLVGAAVLAIMFGHMSPDLGRPRALSFFASIVFLFFMWATFTGSIVRQRWPGSRLARLLPETIHGRPTDEPAARPVLSIVLVLAAAIAVVAWQLLRRR